VEKEALLFLKKKKQKDFFEFRPKAFQTPGSRIKKVFAPLFSKSGRFLI
jgi:hypothetical protein